MAWKVLIVAVVVGLSAGAVWAQGAVEQESRLAMENYDLGDYAAARDALVGVLGRLEAAGQGESPQAIRARVLLAVVYANGLGDPAAAAAQLEQALAVDADVTVDEVYATDATAAAMAAARAARQQAAPAPPDCAALRGMEHPTVTQAEPGAPLVVATRAGKELAGGRLELRYRVADGGAFEAVAMEARGGCEYAAALPIEGLGARVAYYVVAVSDEERTLATRGNEAAPLVATVTLAGANEDARQANAETAEREEVPDALRGVPEQPRGKGCAGCRASGPALSGGWTLALVGWLSLRRRRPCA